MERVDGQAESDKVPLELVRTVIATEANTHSLGMTNNFMHKRISL